MVARREILLSDRVGRSENHISAPVDQKMILMVVNGDRFVGLDDIGTEIWARLERPCAVADLCDALSKAYVGDPVRIQAGVLTFLNQMAAQELIEIAP